MEKVVIVNYYTGELVKEDVTYSDARKFITNHAEENWYCFREDDYEVYEGRGGETYCIMKK